MFCPKCYAQVPDSARFCPVCGLPVPPSEPPKKAKQQHANKSVSKRKKTVSALVIAAVIVLAIAIPAGLSVVKAAQYREAVALLEADMPLEAKEAFDKLGGYRDSADKAEECVKQMDYESAVAQMNTGNFEKAAALFENLGAYRDSAALAQECKNSVAYAAAAELMDKGNDEQAAIAFAALGDFKDAPTLVVACKNRAEYQKAQKLMDEGNYQEAANVFAQIGSYKDATEKFHTCNNFIDYGNAEAEFAQGNFYTAYQIFLKLGEFRDAASRAQACVQPMPKTSQLYRNPAYQSGGCSLTIHTPADNTQYYLKIYADNGDLVCSLFIASGSSKRVSLPAGTYRIRAANGSVWFGEKEKFGDAGSYFELLFDGNEPLVTLKRNYVYTLTLSGVVNGNVGQTKVDGADF